MKEIRAKYWIAEKPEPGKEIPEELKARSNKETYQWVMKYRDEGLARSDMAELKQRSSAARLVLLRFNAKKRIFDVLVGSKA